ncbi:MAG: helix-turn-helix transcriptional regulator [Phycisphaerae bacterium]|nr:helix-turn-helix transcriptional regulator [Phycisphaerae bacterium]
MPRKKEFNPQIAIERATHLFWRRGYHAASMDDLVKAMGVSRQSLYDTFGDKRRLFRAALARYSESELAKELSLLGPRIDAFDGLAKLFANWTGSARSAPDLPAGCLLTNSLIELGDLEPESHAIATELIKRLESAIRFALERADEEGRISLEDGDFADFAGRLMLTRHGLMVARRAGVADGVFRSKMRELMAMLHRSRRL